MSTPPERSMLILAARSNSLPPASQEASVDARPNALPVIPLAGSVVPVIAPP